MDSIIAITDSLPLAGLTSGGYSLSIQHRLPGVNSVAGCSFDLYAEPWTFNGQLSTSNQTNANDKWQNNKVHCTRWSMRSSASAGTHVQGAMRGLIKQDLLMLRAGGTVNLGDTMVIAGNTWTVAMALATTYFIIVRAN